MAEKAKEDLKYGEIGGLIERIFYPTLIIDADFKIQMANSAACEMLGYKKSEINKLDFRKILAVNSDSEVTVTRIAKIGREPIREKLAYYTTKKGEEIPVSFSASIVEFEPGKRLVSTTARDMRQALQYQRELNIYKEKLLKSEKLALIGTIATSMAHELKNPLATIEAAVYNIEETVRDKDSEVMQYIQDIRDEISEASTIIYNLLTFSKTFELRLNYKTTDTHRLIEDVLASLKGTIGGKIKVTKRLAAKKANIDTDESRLRSVLNNLVLNAIQAMPSGGELTVSTAVVPNAHLFEITVRDTGVGISPQNIDRIKEPFFTMKTKGVGLGLSIVDAVVKAHQGTLDIESVPMEGSAFTVRLPVKRPARKEKI